MDASDGEWRAGERPRLHGGLIVAGAVVAVVLTAVIARVDTPAPDGLVVERQTPEPGPSTPTVAEGQWAAIGSWRRMAVSPVAGRSGHAAHWTGMCLPETSRRACGELLVWGGWSGRRPHADGAAYDPATNAWRTLPDAPRSGLLDTPLPSAWTGTRHEATLSSEPGRHGELVVWGATAADLGVAGASPEEPRGVALDPVAGRWRVLPEAPIAPRIGHSMTWTGEEVLVWGGRSLLPDTTSQAFADGAAYDPEADAWRLLPAAPLRARSEHVAVYLPGPHAVLVWGGRVRHDDLAAGPALTDGAVYHVADRLWRRMPPVPLSPVGPATAWRPSAARESSAQDGVLVIAPLVDAEDWPALARYDARSEAWQIRSVGPVGLRSGAQAIGYGSVVVVWGGSHPRDEQRPSGAVYSTITGGWRLLRDRHGPRPGDRAVWTGSELLVWGGGADGAVFDPVAPPGPGMRSHAPGEQRATDLPGGSTTNWPILPSPSGDPVSVTVRGARAVDVEVWLTTGRGSRARRREPLAVDCQRPDACDHRFGPIPNLVLGGLRLHLANGATETAALRVTIEEVVEPGDGTTSAEPHR